MRRYDRHMHQKATYWAYAGNDGFGPTYAPPVVIKCRWQNSNEVYRDSDGKEFVAKSVVYTNAEIAKNGVLALGEHTEMPSNTGEIRHVYVTQNLRNTITLTKAVM